MSGRYRYQKALTVPIYDCDPFLRARTSSLLRYIQTAAGEHLDSLNLTHERLLAEGFVFVVAATALKIYRCPEYNEQITVMTAPVEGVGAHMLRETVICSKSGEALVECQSDWALTDFKSGRLLRASDFPHELPLLEGEWAPFFDPRKIRLHPVCEKESLREVRLCDLDQNIHMNNTVYADILTDCFGEEYLSFGGVDTMLIRYHLQARLGDTLTLKYGKGEGLYTIGALLGEKRCFEGAFSLKSLESSDPQ